VLSNEEREREKFPCLNNLISCEISGFCHAAVEAFALLGCYMKYVGSLPTFRDSLSVPFFIGQSDQKELNSDSTLEEELFWTA
jgi:hypothetical protein